MQRMITLLDIATSNDALCQTRSNVIKTVKQSVITLYHPGYRKLANVVR